MRRSIGGRVWMSHAWLIAWRSAPITPARGEQQQQDARPARAGPCCRARRLTVRSSRARSLSCDSGTLSNTATHDPLRGSPRRRRTGRSRRPAASPAGRTRAPRRTRSARRRDARGRRRTRRSPATSVSRIRSTIRSHAAHDDGRLLRVVEAEGRTDAVLGGLAVRAAWHPRRTRRRGRWAPTTRPCSADAPELYWRLGETSGTAVGRRDDARPCRDLRRAGKRPHRGARQRRRRRGAGRPRVVLELVRPDLAGVDGRAADRGERADGRGVGVVGRAGARLVDYGGFSVVVDERALVVGATRLSTPRHDRRPLASPRRHLRRDDVDQLR